MLDSLQLVVRRLRQAPGFALISLLVVAIGTGAATTIFSAINALILRPIPLPQPERLVVVYETNLPRHITRFSASAPDYRDWRERSQSWESLGATTAEPMTLTGLGDPEVVTVQRMTANLLPTLGIAPAPGRGFDVGEDQPGQNRVAIVGYGFWQRHFGGRSGCSGATLTLDHVPYTIVGVLPAGVFFPGQFEVAIPLVPTESIDRRFNHNLLVYGRLKRGVPIAEARAELKAITDQLYAAYAGSDRQWSADLVPLAREVVGTSTRTTLGLLFGAVGLLLLLTCTNLSGLMLVRVSGRMQEFAVRVALGASRWQVVRQLAAEGLVITFLGGAGGTLLALWGVGLLRHADLPRAAEISIDWRVLAAACGITLISGVLATLGPAIATARSDPNDALKTRTAAAARGARTRDVLVVAQLALALALLVSSAMLVRSFWRLAEVNPGYATENVLTLTLRPAAISGALPRYERIIEQVAALPQVTGTGLVSEIPLTGGDPSNNVYPIGPTPLAAGQSVQSSWRLIDGGYLDAMGIGLRRGRTFAGMSPEQARNSIILSESLARALFGEQDPIGREVEQIRVGGDRLVVAGVVADVRNRRLGEAPGPTFYWSVHRFVFGSMQLVARTSGPTEPLVAAIRQTVREADPAMPPPAIHTMAEIRQSSLHRERLIATILAAFALTALGLAALGTYGVTAFAVQQQTHEIGIRIAIGARASHIVRLVAARGARLLALGALIGTAGSLATAQLLSATLYEIKPTDPASYAIATLGLTLVVVLAISLPARRALAVTPLVALRAE